MRSLYIILSVVGWIWTVVFLAVLWINQVRRKEKGSHE